MRDHLTEEILEEYLLSDGTFGESGKNDVALHLGTCALCREHLAGLTDYHRLLKEELDSPPSERDKALARELISGNRLSLPNRRNALIERSDNLVEAIAEDIEPYRSSFMERIVRYFRIHPIRSAGYATGAAMAIALSIVLLRPQFDKNPSHALVRDGSLIVNNKEGKEVWRKYIGYGYNSLDGEFTDHPERVVNLQDIDRDGRNEVMCVFGWMSMQTPISNTIVCYNSDGTERWKYDIRRSMTVGGISYSDDYRFYHLEAGDFAHSGKIELLAAARHETWSPNLLVRLNPETGTFVSEFWHPGELRKFAHTELDHDGIDDLIYGGQNNRLGHANIVVFDPRSITGAAPVPPEYYPKEIPAGTEKYYIMFPWSDMKFVRNDVTNEVVGVHVTKDNMTEVIVDERGPESGGIYYYFDSTMTCVSARPADAFTSTHVRLEHEGKLTDHLTDEYFEALRKGVMYWDGDKFVLTPTINRHYSEARRSLQSP